MKYRALVFFTDLKDNKHAYKPGDIYPREGLQVSKGRLEELSTNKNKRGMAMIEAVEESEKKAEPKAKPKAKPKAEPKAQKPEPVEAQEEEPLEILEADQLEGIEAQEEPTPKKRKRKNAD